MLVTLFVSQLLAVPIRAIALAVRSCAQLQRRVVDQALWCVRRGKQGDSLQKLCGRTRQVDSVYVHRCKLWLLAWSHPMWHLFLARDGSLTLLPLHQWSSCWWCGHVSCKAVLSSSSSDQFVRNVDFGLQLWGSLCISASYICWERSTHRRHKSLRLPHAFQTQTGKPKRWKSMGRLTRHIKG